MSFSIFSMHFNHFVSIFNKRWTHFIYGEILIDFYLFDFIYKKMYMYLNFIFIPPLSSNKHFTYTISPNDEALYKITNILVERRGKHLEINVHVL